MIIKNTQKGLVGLIFFLIATFTLQLITSSSFHTNLKKSERTQKTAIPISYGETENSESNNGTDDDNVQKEIDDFEKLHIDRHRPHSCFLNKKYAAQRTETLSIMPNDVFSPPPEI